MKTLKNVTGSLQRATSILAFLLAAAMAGIIAPPAAAQFNGPALPSSSGVNIPTSPTTDQALLFPTGKDVRLNSGDQISVRVFGPSDYLSTVRIATDGKVQLPLIGPVLLQGLTVAEAENLIAHLLVVDGMFRDPQVTVQLLEGPNATISLIGEVHGVVPALGQRRLLDILAASGGLPATASHVITIDRPGLKDAIVVDLGTDPARSAAANIPVFPGDTIVTARVGVVYVIGAFKTQGAIPIVGNTPLTLLQITALTGGPNFEGQFNDLRIIRTTGNKRSLVRLNIKNVLYGKDPDPVLQADDIIFLPDNALKSAIKNGGLGILFSTASFLISLVTFTR